MKNTRIQYLYRDASNYKRWNIAVVKGEISQDQIGRILSCLLDGEYFIPEQVGLMADRLDEYPRSQLPRLTFHKSQTGLAEDVR